MVKRVCCLFLVAWLLTAPVLALDNTVGVIQADLRYAGFSIGHVTNINYPSTNNVVNKSYDNTADINLNGQTVYFFYTIPSGVETVVLDGYIEIACPMYTDDLKFYKTTKSLWEGELIELGKPSLSSGGWSAGGCAYTYSRIECDLTDATFLIIGWTAGAYDIYLDMAIAFSEQGTTSGTSGYIDTQAYNTYTDIYTMNTSDPIWTYYPGYNTVYNSANYITFAQGATTIPSHRDSLSLYGQSYSGTLTADSGSSYRTASEFSIVYGDDGGLVDEVFDQGDTLDQIEDETFDQGETLDQIAGDMTKIVEDMQAKADTADDIGGATSEDTITGTQETMSTGLDGLSSGLTVVQDIDTISAPASGYIGLLSATVTPMLNFGNGVLYWALFAMIIGSVILFILRRLQ